MPRPRFNRLQAVGGRQLVGPALIPFFGEREVEHALDEAGRWAAGCPHRRNHDPDGSLVFEGYRPVKDAFQVARMRDAGVVIIGKTNMSEFANFGATARPRGRSGKRSSRRRPAPIPRTSGPSRPTPTPSGRPTGRRRLIPRPWTARGSGSSPRRDTTPSYGTQGSIERYNTILDQLRALGVELVEMTGSVTAPPNVPGSLGN